jgi:transcriptional regulator with XRE-family HTH domain
MPKERNRAPFDSFGADMKEARKALDLSQKTLAEMVNIDPRYLANIENSGNLPSLPVFFEIVTICKLPPERYFYPELDELKDSRKVKRIITKIRLCPEQYLSVVEGTVNEVLKLDRAEDK